MFGRKPLFPGRDFLHTLSLICRVVGTPTEDTVGRMPALDDRAKSYLHSIPFHAPVNFANMFPYADPLALDLLQKLLVFE